MKIADKWLREFIKTDLTTEAVAEILTDIGLEVEGVEKYESVKGGLKGVVIGKVLTCEQHPNADRLKTTTVDAGIGEPLHIVCGAPNVAAGQTVAVATVGTEIFLKDGDSFTIKKSKIRGEVSEGMLCAEDELGLGESHDGIMVLPDDYKIGKPLAEYLSISEDEVYEIGLTPNRTDAMSHYGVARDLFASLHISGEQAELLKLEKPVVESTSSHDFSVTVEDERLIPRYMGAIIEGVKVGPSPEWLQHKLQSIGLSPINNVVDITNFILHSYGQPLHAFDADKISGNRVVVGTVDEGTKFTTLDGTERTLNGKEIMIKDGDNKAMCIAGVFGGAESGVSENTVTVFLESAYFNPVAVRKASKAHGLNTDASFRFERGVDPEMTETALLKAVELLQEIAGGHLVGEIIDIKSEIPQPVKSTLKLSRINQLLGINIPEDTVKDILKVLDIDVVSQNDDVLEVSVPTYRADVTREVDVIEEILRIYGYNKIEAPGKIAFTPVKLAYDDEDSLLKNWANILVANGFFEVMNNSLTHVEDNAGAVKLLNPLSSELSCMRVSLLEGLLENAEYNINRKRSDLKLFEVGKIYGKREQYHERRQMVLLVTGKQTPESWAEKQKPTDFYYLKSFINLLMEKAGITVDEKALDDSRFSEGLEMSVGGKTVARIGIISPKLLKTADIDQAVYYAEIEVEHMQALRNTQLKFRPLPKFNKTRRDLALLVDKEINYRQLYDAAIGQSPYLKNINLFDVYEGKNLPEGKKSYAMSFELLREDKTLEDKEINAVMEKLIKIYRKSFGAELRS